jgi:ABC-type multidrug transport system fused ATPase/permease subunit
VKDFGTRLKKFFVLLGRKNLILLSLGILVGIGWFAVETGFVYILQLFFAAIGLITPAQFTFLPNLPKGLNFACVVLLVFAILRFAVNAARAYLAIVTQHGFVYRIRTMLSARALQGEVSLSSHDVLGLFSEVTNNGGYLVYNLTMLVVDAFASAFFLAAAFYIAPFQAMIGLTVILLAFWPIKYGVNRIGRLGKYVQEEWENVNYELSTAIKNKFLLKLYGTVGIEVARGERSLNTYFNHQKKYAFWFGFLTACPTLVGAFCIILVVLVSSKYSTISPMNLTAFLYIFMRLAQVGSETNSLLSLVRFYVPAVQVLYDWLYRKQPALPAESDGGRKLESIKSIRFANVDFAFDGRRVLSNLAFEISSGECLAIVGPSGSGKSTLLSVLLGLLRPIAGEVLVDNFAIAGLHPSWRDKIAYVGPDPFTIEGTLRENLLYGNKDRSVTDDRCWEILELVSLKKEISEIPQGLDFHLKSASRFSSGQLQRISIARALLRDFDVLIFDEGTANLDAATAGMILNRVRALTVKKIFIRVTHQGVSPNLEKVIDLESRDSALAQPLQAILPLDNG